MRPWTCSRSPAVRAWRPPRRSAGVAHPQPRPTAPSRKGLPTVGMHRPAQEHDGPRWSVTAGAARRDHQRRPAEPAARHRPGRDPGVAGVPRRGRRPRRAQPRPLPHAAACCSGPASSRSACPSLRSTDYINTIPPERGAVVPRRRGRRAPDPRLHPLERRDHGAPGPAARASASAGTSRPTPRRRSLYEVGFNHFFRGKDHPGGGDQIFFQGHASPGIYARAFLEGRLTEHQLDGFRQELSHPGGGLSVLPAPAADAGLLGVPDRLDGPRPAQRDLPGPVQPLPAQPRDQGHQPAARLGVPRRRRDGRARVARRDRRWPPARSSTTSPSSSTATCSASTARSAATARSSRSWSRSSAAPAGTSSR